MESLLTKLYSHCKVAESEAASNSSGKSEIAVHSTKPEDQQKPSKSRAVDVDERASLLYSEVLPTRSLDSFTDSSDIRSHVSALEPRLSGECLNQPGGVSNLPCDSVAHTMTDCQQYEKMESCDETASVCPSVGQRSDARRSSEGDIISLSRQEMESFELLDISDFENDNSSESLPPSPDPQPVPQSTSQQKATEVAGNIGCSAFQSKCMHHSRSLILDVFILFGSSFSELVSVE